MTSRRISPVILCGGSGTRLWPRSRASRPKPFLPLVGGQTLFEEALLRCRDKELFDSPTVVTGAGLLGQVDKFLGQAPGTSVIVEPAAKNTAAAIALAAYRLPRDGIMLVCPSDHHISDLEAFVRSARLAAELAAEGWLVTFGIRPTSPETGYGYLRRGEPLHEGWRVREFVEKPDAAKARYFMQAGDYVWNGGIFAFQAGQFIEELDRHRPDLNKAIGIAVANGHAEGSCFYPDPVAFSHVAAESVDYAVMENAKRVAMVPADFGWSDIGNWRAVREARERDESGNSVRGPAELVDCEDVLVDSDGPRVHVIGLKDVLVVVDGNDIIVTTADSAPSVAKLAGARAQ